MCLGTPTTAAPSQGKLLGHPVHIEVTDCGGSLHNIITTSTVSERVGVTDPANTRARDPKGLALKRHQALQLKLLELGWVMQETLELGDMINEVYLHHEKPGVLRLVSVIRLEDVWSVSLSSSLVRECQRTIGH